jgi:hypothetical protein
MWQSKELHKLLPEVPLQPDIDILWKSTDKSKPELGGVEVKIITANSKDSLSLPYYRGIDETLALLRFGLDRVLLFELFLISLDSEEVTNAVIQKYFPYQEATINLLKTLRLPIGYRAAFDFVINDQISEDRIKVIDTEDNQLRIDPPLNPYLKSNDKREVGIIREYLLQRFRQGVL